MNDLNRIDVSVEVLAVAALSPVVCTRAGNLAAYGLVDAQIADALLISRDQVATARNTEEFRKAFSETTLDRQTRQIDLEEGWDAIETRALETVLQTLEYNKDPRFALLAARTANQAKRRGGSADQRVIDATKAGTVIVLNLNQKFVNGNKTGENTAALDITPRTGVQPEKRIDLPTPKRVAELLRPEGLKLADKYKNATIEEAMKEAGILDDKGNLE